MKNNGEKTATMSLLWRSVITLVLALLALAGNYLHLPLFFGVDLIFGSVAVMLAIALVGVFPALLVALVGGAYTVVLWGHPYALLIFVAEAACVGVLYRRGWHNLVLLDLLYWVCVGIPLVLIFYRGFLDMAPESAYLVAIKQPLNGVTNALLAGLALLVMAALPRVSGWLGLNRIPVFHLVFHASMLMVVLAAGIPVWYESRLQRLDEESFMFERLQEKTKELTGRISGKGDQGRHRLDYHLLEVQTLPLLGLALLDDRQSVVASIGEIETLHGGTLTPVSETLAVWLPEGSSSAMQRWKQGRYLMRAPVTQAGAVASVLVEYPALPLVQSLEHKRMVSMQLLTAIMLAAMVFSFWVSRLLTLPLQRLELASRDLNERIVRGERPTMPDSSVYEYLSLANTLNRMSQSLMESFAALKQARDELETQVGLRTHELASKTDQLTTLLDAAADFSVIATDCDGLITVFNRGAERMLGYSADELVGRQSPALLHVGDDVVALSQELSQELGEPVTGFRVFVAKPERDGSETREWTYIAKSGQTIPVQLTVTAIRNRDKVITGYLGIGVDIRERKEAEQALQDQVHKTAAIIDNMVDGLITIDRHGIVLSFNGAAERILGYTAAEVIGRNVNVLMSGPHAEQHDQYLASYLATGVARIIGTGREVEALHKDGTLIPVDLSVSQTFDKGVPLFIGLLRDIRERKRIERLKSEFISTVSHELRTPLTAISGALGLLANGMLGNLSEQGEYMVSIAQKNSVRLSQLINDLLDIEKIAAGKLQLDMRPHGLQALLTQAVEVNKTFGANRGVMLALDMEVQVSRVPVWTDAQRLQQVLANLISNAIKFSPANATVQVSVTRATDRVRLTVKDQGPGIPAEFRTRIFQKFSQADSSDTRQKGGTGLGLAISRDLVERMGGRIGFESVEGQGASFWIELPLAPDGSNAVAGPYCLF
ncbi:MAG: PAS domain S-box protein [Gammaproteobacteria bacterium]